MKINRALFAVPFFVVSNAEAAVPNPNNNAAAFFLQGTFMSVPQEYSEGSGNSYILRTRPIGNSSAPAVNTLWQWSYVFSNQPATVSYSPTIDGYPSFAEGSYGRECVSFAKAVMGVTQNTGNWYPVNSVIPTNPYVTWDVSWQHAGRMVAYFGANPNPNTPYNSHIGNPNHVGIFLKYQYDNTTFPANITGFWIVDENFSYPEDGKIRKHFIPLVYGNLPEITLGTTT